METRIPMLDLSAEVDELWDELQAAIQGVLRSGQFIMGPNVKAFEQEAADYLGVKHAIGMNSGTDALFIALRALNIGSGDEVITTPFTFFATAEAISHVGATPVFVDIDPRTFNIDPSLVEAAITPRTKAIIPVHLFGQAADMDPLMELAERYHLEVVEDAAQAFGAEYKGHKAGTIGSAGAFSFFPTKNLGAYGDGGLFVTNNDKLAETVRMLRFHGSKKKYHNELVGYNSRLDEIQAAILRLKLARVNAYNEARRRAAGVYSGLFDGMRNLAIPSDTADTKHIFHQYTVRVRHGKRNAVQEALSNAGIDTMIYYPVPVHLLPVYRGCALTMPLAEQAADEVLSLPIWPQMSVEVQQRVARVLCAILQ